ncbi:hypothetical protein VNI00_015323 [Paramarasmius palmivorus]|uniref:O-methyltransferase domain-containing protein n=1 Tax=Paramarasmius palmivorus TaxID=297713 RepID=A0AAW0BM25_9AGAR
MDTQLLNLTSLITSAVQSLISTGHPILSLNSVETTPFDSSGPESLSPEVIQAITTIEAACAQLVYTVSNPGSTLLTKALAHNESACLAVVTNAKIADLLANEPEGIPVGDLAGRAGFEDADKLGRIMRLLATRHVFREVAPGVFANNRLSKKLVSSDPTSDIVSLLTNESLLASAYLHESVTQEGQEIPFKRATGHAFFDYYKTVGSTFFDHYEDINLIANQDKGKKQGERFPRAMIGWGDITGKGFLQKVYPWSSLPPNVKVCDIGGGNGHVTMGLMRAHPHLKIVLQDQPQVIEQAKVFWQQHHPDAVHTERIAYVPFDFFKDPAAPGCDVYYIRSILRDWPDAESLLILQNVRKSMSPSSRLIIHDTVLRPSTTGSAPPPLLPNWGAAKARTYELDMTMMNLLGAKARTLDEFKVLCDKANLRFERIYEAGETDLVDTALVACASQSLPSTSTIPIAMPPFAFIASAILSLSTWPSDNIEDCQYYGCNGQLSGVHVPGILLAFVWLVLLVAVLLSWRYFSKTIHVPPIKPFIWERPSDLESEALHEKNLKLPAFHSPSGSD